jgi:hypothetical protein
MDFGLKFEFARYLAVYRGIPRHTALPLPDGKNVAVGKKRPAAGRRRLISSASGSGGSDAGPRRPVHVASAWVRAGVVLWVDLYHQTATAGPH